MRILSFLDISVLLASAAVTSLKVGFQSEEFSFGTDSKGAYSATDEDDAAAPDVANAGRFGGGAVFCSRVG